jgi:hypothetical protein
MKWRGVDDSRDLAAERVKRSKIEKRPSPRV